jgi:hypothetical protein
MNERFQQLLARLSYKDWRFVLGQKGDAWYLQLRWEAASPFSGHVSEQSSRKWLLSEHMTDSEVVQTALLAVLTAEEHEAREHFQFDGASVFAPHYDVRALAKVQDRDVRGPH